MKREFIRQNVGIDVSKDDFKVALCCLTSDLQVVVHGPRTFANHFKGFQSFMEWLDKKIDTSLPLSFTLEATGVYYESLAYYIYDQSHTIHVVLPNQSKKYGQSLGLKSKTDKMDAQVLARMGLKESLPHQPAFNWFEATHT